MVVGSYPVVRGWLRGREIGRKRRQGGRSVCDSRVSQGTFSDVMASGGARFPRTDALAGRPSDSRIASADFDSNGSSGDSSDACTVSMLDWICCCLVFDISISAIVGTDTPTVSFCATGVVATLETNLFNPNNKAKVMHKSATNMNVLRFSAMFLFEDSSIITTCSSWASPCRRLDEKAIFSTPRPALT